MRCCAAMPSHPSCAGATRRACIDRRDARGHRPASSSAPSGSPDSSVVARRGGWSPGGAARRRVAGTAMRVGPPFRPATGQGRRAGGGQPQAGRAGGKSAHPPGQPRTGGPAGGWRQTRGGPGRENTRPLSSATTDVMPGERFANRPGDEPFVAGDIADRGPLERGVAATTVDTRAREARELDRQKAWRDQASRAMQSYKAEEGTGPVNADATEATGETDDGDLSLGAAEGEYGETILVPGGSPLPTLRVLPQGVSRKRLEQAVRDLGLPVVIARDVDEADVVMTLKNEYKQKTPLLREAEERAMPIYVLKSNTIPQMQSSLTSIFSLEIDPREAALRETEDAIEAVLQSSEAIELSPQNAYIRRLQHQMAERANLVSRSRGREPFRRVRLYPDAARSTWR